MPKNNLKRFSAQFKKSPDSLLANSELIARKALYRGGAEYLKSIPLSCTKNVAVITK
jgi:hypothetical protein